MSLEVDAVYEHGTLKLSEQVPLLEGQKVKVTIRPTTAVERLYGSIPWTGTHEELEDWLNDDDEGIFGGHDI